MVFTPTMAPPIGRLSSAVKTPGIQPVGTQPPPPSVPAVAPPARPAAPAAAPGIRPIGTAPPPPVVAPAPRPVPAAAVSPWKDPNRLASLPEDAPAAPRTPTPPPPEGVKPPGTGLAAAFDKILPGFSGMAPSAAPHGLPSPLTGLTHHLGSFKGTADGVLGFIQRMAANNPQGFQSIVNGLGGGLTKGLAGTPFGIPAMLGLDAAVGGQSLPDAVTYFRPLLSKLGLS